MHTDTGYNISQSLYSHLKHQKSYVLASSHVHVLYGAVILIGMVKIFINCSHKKNILNDTSNL
jgi:hypothetical protein